MNPSTVESRRLSLVPFMTFMTTSSPPSQPRGMAWHVLWSRPLNDATRRLSSVVGLRVHSTLISVISVDWTFEIFCDILLIKVDSSWGPMWTKVYIYNVYSRKLKDQNICKATMWFATIWQATKLYKHVHYKSNWRVCIRQDVEIVVN